MPHAHTAKAKPARRRSPSRDFTLKAFRAFIEAQPARKEYFFFDRENCPIAQFFRAKGYCKVDIGGFSASVDGKEIDLDNTYDKKIINRACSEYTYTFGALAQRLRAITPTPTPATES